MSALARALLLRAVSGLAGAAAAGALAYGRRLFDPTDPAFQCFTVGALAAALVALVRLSRAGHALVLAGAASLLQLGFAASLGLGAALSMLALTAGLLLLADLFESLRRAGLAFGKFLLLGPLLGGLYLALTPMAEWQTLTHSTATVTLLRRFYLGLVIGDGVGLGAELADLVAAATARMRRASPAEGGVKIPAARGPQREGEAER